MQHVLNWAPILKENGQELKETVCNLLHVEKKLGKKLYFYQRVEAKTAIDTSN